MTHCTSAFQRILLFCLFTLSMAFNGCGTLDVAIEGTSATSDSPGNPTATTGRPGQDLTAPPDSLADNDTGQASQAIAWYGIVHSQPGANSGGDYFKPWHLNIWPKFGPAVGIIGADEATNAEIDRLRDSDIKVTLWGRFMCGVADYGGCQFLVTRLSADDGGPGYDPEPVDGWKGTLGSLSGQPGSQDNLLYFVLDGKVPVLYGIGGGNLAMKEELAVLSEVGASVRIWGELSSKAQPVTGTLIDVERLDVIGYTPP